MPGLVCPRIEPFVRSATVSVWVPTVLRVTFNERNPFTSAPLTGVLAAPSLEVMRTLSALGTWFHQASVDHTLTANACPALCDDGVPVLPVALPGSAASPGTISWTRENAAGCTTNGSLVPFLPSASASHA